MTTFEEGVRVLLIPKGTLSRPECGVVVGRDEDDRIRVRWDADGSETSEDPESLDAEARPFVPAREIPEPQAWESRENYNARTGQNLDRFDWYELVAASVIRAEGVVGPVY